MRAVNLIPAEARRGGGAGAGGRSGGAAYILLGGLAIVVGLVAVWALAGHHITSKRSELARLQSETSTAQTEAARLASYARYAQLSKDRVDTVRSLATSRFDWAQALDAVARTLPSDAWLTSMTGTVAPGVSVNGGGSAASNLRSQRQVPAIELVGCSTSQRRVGQLISRLRAVPGVDRVSIADSTKGDSGSGGGGGCRGAHADYPQFDMVLFFGNSAPPAGPSSPTSADGAAPAPAPAPTTSSSGSTPPSTPSSASPSSATPAPAPSSGASK